jgi:hypothetical protein
MYVFGEWHDEQNYAIGENHATVSSCAIERLAERIFGAYAQRRIEAETNTPTALKSPRLIGLAVSYKIPFSS